MYSSSSFKACQLTANLVSSITLHTTFFLTGLFESQFHIIQHSQFRKLFLSENLLFFYVLRKGTSQRLWKCLYGNGLAIFYHQTRQESKSNQYFILNVCLVKEGMYYIIQYYKRIKIIA